MPIVRRLLPLLIPLALLCALRLLAEPRGQAVVTPPAPRAARRILLVPLDSRPPCGRFVRDAARIANIDILLPPAALMDDYRTPGDAEALRAWTAAHLADCDAAILSVDQLLHGGLLASREAQKTPADEEAVLAFLRALHAAHPGVPLYAFSILPRLTPPDGLGDWHEQQRLMRYSRLLGRIARLPRPADADLAEIEALRASISPEGLARYESLFAGYAAFGERLMRLAEENVLARLVIGQDDSERYGLPNLIRLQLAETRAARRLDDTRVFLTHGADELALSLLAAIEAERDGFAPRIALAYGAPDLPRRVLPYMGATLEETAREKLRLVNAVPAAPEDALFILFLSAGDAQAPDARRRAAQALDALVREKRRAALVDLAVHFRADETLLPLLLENGTPLHALAAYAGWNTASNAVGTAVAHAVLLETALRRAAAQEDALRALAAHLAFLDSRFLEDHFYLKDIVDHINFSLEKCGAQNGRGLEYNYNRPLADALLDAALQNRLARLTASAAFRAPADFQTPDGPVRLRVADLRAAARYPWPRTFEIDLRTSVRLEIPPEASN